MSSLAVVPVFYLDQDASWQPPCRQVSRIEARRLKQTGAGCFIEHGRAFRLKDSSPPPPCGFLPGLLETAATITLSEIEANVGIAPTANLVIRAQHKIRAYPHIYDQLAVLARGSWGQADGSNCCAMTCLVEIRDGNGQVGILSTHLPEFAAILKMLLKQAGYTTKTKCYTDHPEETQ